MKKETYLTLFLLITGFHMVTAQLPTTQVLPDTSKMTYKQISQTGNLVVFPASNQSNQKQKEDEFDRYLWAMDQTGIDPLNLPKVEAQVQTGPTGGAVRGAGEKEMKETFIKAFSACMEGKGYVVK